MTDPCRKTHRPHLFTFALALILGGCMQTVQHPAGPSRPDPGRRPVVEKQIEPGPMTVDYQVEGSKIRVEASEPQVCTTKVMTPLIADQTTERSLTASGVVGQAALALGAIAFVGGGAYLLSNSCIAAEANGIECYSQVETPTKVGGGVAVGLGALLGAAFIVNMISVSDSEEVVWVDPSITESGPSLCGIEPVAVAQVEIWFTNGYVVTGETDMQGIAYFDLASVPADRTFAQFPEARVFVKKRELDRLNFGDTDLFARSQQLLQAPAPSVPDAAPQPVFEFPSDESSSGGSPVATLTSDR